MPDKKYDLEDRLVDFAANVALFTEELPHNFIGNYYGNQLLRSGGSSALNFGEAQGGKYGQRLYSSSNNLFTGTERIWGEFKGFG